MARFEAHVRVVVCAAGWGPVPPLAHPRSRNPTDDGSLRTSQNVRPPRRDREGGTKADTGLSDRGIEKTTAGPLSRGLDAIQVPEIEKASDIVRSLEEWWAQQGSNLGPAD